MEISKQYTDPTSKITYKFKSDEVISVYLRRSNGKKRLVFSSRSPEKSFTLYHSTKIFIGERKYLESKFEGTELQILAESGTDQRPLAPRLGVKGEKNYHYASLPGIPRVPKTLNDTLMRLLNGQRSPDGDYKITRNKLIPMLLAYYVSLSQEERDTVNLKSHEEFIKHKMKSGANMTEQYSKILEKENLEDEELL